jgi:hypothetical protein
MEGELDIPGLTNRETNQTAIWVLTQNCYQRSHGRNKSTSAARDKQSMIEELRITLTISRRNSHGQGRKEGIVER